MREVLDLRHLATSVEHVVCKTRTSFETARSSLRGIKKDQRGKNWALQSVGVTFPHLTLRLYSKRLVLLKQSEGHQTPHRCDWERDIRYSSKRTIDSYVAGSHQSRRLKTARPRWRSCVGESGVSVALLILSDHPYCSSPDTTLDPSRRRHGHHI